MAPKIRKLIIPDEDCGYDCDEDEQNERMILRAAEDEVWSYDRKSRRGIINGDYTNFQEDVNGV